MNEDQNIRAALDRHWGASDANDFEAEHEIYHDDAVLEYPQSGERIHGRRKIQASRFAQPNKKRFLVRRVLGAADLWITEFVLTYDGLPSYTVSIMEFRDRKVAREIQYFGDTESDFICLDDGDSIPQSGGEGPSLPPFTAETAAQKARL